jgi:hypothetical protein
MEFFPPSPKQNNKKTKDTPVEAINIIFYELKTRYLGER